MEKNPTECQTWIFKGLSDDTGICFAKQNAALVSVTNKVLSLTFY